MSLFTSTEQGYLLTNDQQVHIVCIFVLPLPGDGEEGSDKLPPVRFGVHVHAEIHGSLQESTHCS